MQWREFEARRLRWLVDVLTAVIPQGVAAGISIAFAEPHKRPRPLNIKKVLDSAPGYVRRKVRRKARARKRR